MTKRLAASFALAVAVLLALPAFASASEVATLEISVNSSDSTDSVSVTSPTGSYAALSEVNISAVSGDSAPIELVSKVRRTLSDSLGGLDVSVRAGDASASPQQLTDSGALADGEPVQGKVSIDASDMKHGFTAFLAQPTLVGLSMGALLWIAIAVAALIVGLFALGRSKDRVSPGSRSTPVSN